MRERDQLPPRPRRSPLPNMLGDKHTKSNPSKPLTPALSSNFRNAKSPLTPRLVASASSSPVLSARREPFVRSRSPAKPDQVTSPLNGNITPRSGARKSRVGTESPSTPASSKTVNNGGRSRTSPGYEAPKPSGGHMSGLGITSPRLAASTNALPRLGTPTSTPVVTVHRRISAAKSMVEGDKSASSKFFHASEVRSTIGSPGLEEGLRYSPGRSQFFVGSPPLPSTNPNQRSGEDITSRGDPDEKFFRVNDIPSHAHAKRPPLPHIPTEKLKSVPTIGQPFDTNLRPNRTSPLQSPSKAQRPFLMQPTSPQKVQSVSTPSPPPPRIHQERPKSTANTTSVSPPRGQGHRKSSSASSITSTPIRKMSGLRAHPPQPLDLRLAPAGSPSITGNNILSPDTLSPRSISLASTNTVPTSVTSDTDSSDVAKLPTVAATPSDSRIDQLNPPYQPQLDDAANARRERKVLDLEISNSSLLAINKTLERELRKQSGELRRYRRLSQSGRLSIAPTARTVSEQSTFSLGTVTELDDEDQQLSDLGEDSDLDDVDDEDGSLLSNEFGSINSPSVRSRQRARDEKRLMQDLSKHHQLLLDSQKLSQSIKRCLTCTEELIRDGNKALNYRVGIGDVQLGGRVLNDDELDERGLAEGMEEPGARQGLLSPSLAKAASNDPHLWVSSPPTIAIATGVETTTESTGLASLDELTSLLESFATDLEKP